MRLVGTAESIGWLTAQLITYSLQITFWQDHVAIEYQKILTLGALGTIVAIITVGFRLTLSHVPTIDNRLYGG